MCSTYSAREKIWSFEISLKPAAAVSFPEKLLNREMFFERKLLLSTGRSTYFLLSFGMFCAYGTPRDMVDRLGFLRFVHVRAPRPIIRAYQCSGATAATLQIATNPAQVRSYCCMVYVLG